MRAFARSQLGKVVAKLAQTSSQRPSDILGIEDSALSRLLWDLAITSEISIPAVDIREIASHGRVQSVKDRVREKRRRMGISSYIR